MLISLLHIGCRLSVHVVISFDDLGDIHTGCGLRVPKCILRTLTPGAGSPLIMLISLNGISHQMRMLCMCVLLFLTVSASHVFL